MSCKFQCVVIFIKILASLLLSRSPDMFFFRSVPYKVGLKLWTFRGGTAWGTTTSLLRDHMIVTRGSNGVVSRSALTFLCGIYVYGVTWILLGQSKEETLSPNVWKQFMVSITIWYHKPLTPSANEKSSIRCLISPWKMFIETWVVAQQISNLSIS